MAVKDKNPFGGPSVEEGQSPFSEPGATAVIKCPSCGEHNPNNLDSRNTPFQLFRICKTCGNEWSCGSVGGLLSGPPPPMRAETEVDYDVNDNFVDRFRTNSFDPFDGDF